MPSCVDGPLAVRRFDIGAGSDASMCRAGLVQTFLKGLVSLLRKEVTSRRASVLVIDGIVSARCAAADEQAFNKFTHELQAVAMARTALFLFAPTADGRNASTTKMREHKDYETSLRAIALARSSVSIRRNVARAWPTTWSILR